MNLIGWIAGRKDQKDDPAFGCTIFGDLNHHLLHRVIHRSVDSIDLRKCFNSRTGTDRPASVLFPTARVKSARRFPNRLGQSHFAADGEELEQTKRTAIQILDVRVEEHSYLRSASIVGLDGRMLVSTDPIRVNSQTLLGQNALQKAYRDGLYVTGVISIACDLNIKVLSEGGKQWNRRCSCATPTAMMCRAIASPSRC